MQPGQWRGLALSAGRAREGGFMPAGTLARRDQTITETLLDLRPLSAARRMTDPYPWIAASRCLSPAALPALRRDFPRLSRPGYHPVGQFTARGLFAELLAEVEA